MVEQIKELPCTFQSIFDFYVVMQQYNNKALEILNNMSDDDENWTSIVLA
jgi:hypothetical protein